ncbi:hypothetical protein [Streptomyces lavendofoliae]|uniref:Uncharacterized protein n=1 Tax=Streptomyces lavendofoliae TaxID=67314 RepID=A0A918HWH1_9ACTN|nr:hypothetical protein [Streptomyces lavendofoliae]GGU29545.1 hypothetical protein GCM10010274_15590 [Streptomyces lavendofoliae]
MIDPAPGSPGRALSSFTIESNPLLVDDAAAFSMTGTPAGCPYPFPDVATHGYAGVLAPAPWSWAGPLFYAPALA